MSIETDNFVNPLQIFSLGFSGGIQNILKNQLKTEIIDIVDKKLEQLVIDLRVELLQEQKKSKEFEEQHYNIVVELNDQIQQLKSTCEKLEQELSEIKDKINKKNEDWEHINL